MDGTADERLARLVPARLPSEAELPGVVRPRGVELLEERREEERRADCACRTGVRLAYFVAS